MGLLKAAMGAAGGALADTWREYFYCESMDADTLVAKGEKRTSKRSSNKRGEENIISNGSIIAVNDGQCMLIVEQGKVVEVCAEPGEFVYDSSTEPSVFYGGLGEGIKQTFSQIGKRFTYGGDAGKDQRVFYINTKEIMGNKYGTPSPIPFRVIDESVNLILDITVRCHGEYSYKITNPLLFYTNVCANVEDWFLRDEIDSQLKSELLTALQPAIARLSTLKIPYSFIPAHTMEIADSLNELLSKKWKELRGIEIVVFGISSISTDKESEEKIQEVQRNATFRDKSMAAAHLVGAQAQAMQDAAKNEGGMGAMGGFFGMNMAQNAGSNINSLYQMADQQNQANQQAQTNAAPVNNGWTCSCGATGNTGKFCSECGKPKPQEKGWICSCGAVNKGKFCSECGAKKPAGALLYKCDKCGWEPEDPAHPPKFCPECGDPFDDNDIK